MEHNGSRFGHHTVEVIPRLTSLGVSIGTCNLAAPALLNSAMFNLPGRRLVQGTEVKLRLSPEKVSRRRRVNHI